jgi:NadR type nicotinamide-nucleotide adenylyltransferase
MEKANKTMTKKIVIIGPESTGKSSLCSDLATHYNTVWCAEYARQYLTEHGTNYNYNDLLTIAQGQKKLEDETVLLAHNKQYVFIDTNQFVMQVWCEYVFGQCHNWILDTIATNKYDFYLLCNTDLPWTKDNLREYPDEKPRNELFAIYKELLQQQSTPWAIVSGASHQRTPHAISIIDVYFK